MTPSGSYPQARRADVTETIHGQLVSDPYQWLEDPDSAETKAWLAAQDALYADQAAEVRPQREALAARITELLEAGEAGLPRWRGERRFYTRRRGGQEHAVLYTQAPGEDERVLIDPTAIDPSGTTTLDDWRPDIEGRLLAYQLSSGGSEESVLQVMDVATGMDVDGPIDRCRYSDVAWLPGGDAFFYSRRLAPDQVPAGEQQYHRRVYLHRVGSAADEDVLIFGAGRDKTSYYSVSVSRDGRWLQLAAAAGTAPRNDMWLADLTGSPAGPPALSVVQEGADAQAYGQVGNDGRLYLLTDRDAPRGRLVVTDPASPGHEYWRDLVPQDPEAVLTGYAILDGQELPGKLLLCSWTRHAIGEVTVHDLADGTALGTVALPGLGTVEGLSAHPEGGHEAWIRYTDYRTPPMVLRYDGRTGSVDEWDRVPGAALIPEITARQVSYQSADGTTIRMLVISGGAEESTDAAGAAPRPAILYGYGGFNVSLTPAYAPAILAWTEAGGVYAIAGLRGGSEEGEQWHRAGMREHKQNVFDDFAAAAKALVSGGWTTSGQLAVSGGSNGGLLVGATVTQHPQLCAAAICSAPLLDMIRYERFGLGESWNDEYGTAANPEEFGWLLSYSPYHHVVDGTSYPAVLFTVFDGDTRVDPLHARKMCAALQHATAARYQDRPILLRREADVGHGARAVSRSAALSAETLAFASLHTGLSR
ncbi:MAG TPA: prolyl oligopeptidase family serine peptidase [Streptosporangiaceae bacterium]|jgi:prolyl oligopeptidase